MNIGQIKYMYFLGVGGIGMSALARYFNKLGVEVSGYDKTQTPLTDQLQKEGIEIHFEDKPKLIPEKTELVVYTPAIPNDSEELRFIKEKNIPLFKRSEVLGEITKGKFTIAVAGTHGKTTISSMIAHIFQNSDVSITALIGGIVNEYNSNFIGNADGEVFVVEADEYDRSFLTLNPDIALISSMDADHLDIYGSENHLLESFELFAKKIKPNGNLILKNGLTLNVKNTASYSYALSTLSNFYCKKFEIKDGEYLVDLKIMEDQLDNIRISIPGRHNVENAIGAASVAKLYGLSDERIINGLETYPGVKRRFETIIKQDNLIYIDDYAHHPEELKACITSVKELYPEKKITGIFQPHLFSRTRDFVNEFARSLELLDELILMDIYPAREKPIVGINAKYLFDKINLSEKYYKTKEEIIAFVEGLNPEVLLSLGAGNIDQLVEPLKTKLQS
jgi:UDP-N-acetylmuramate--alanine ligase